ncbi:MAG: B12-binding domain-containing radical SAM protein [Magnetovibrionaceae bacterium]
MHVLFVYPDITYEEYRTASVWKGKYYTGIGHLSSWLKSKGHTTSLYHVTHDITAEEFAKKLATYENVDLIGFSYTTQMSRFAKRYIAACKELWPNVPVISGGAFPTLVPDRVFTETQSDFACVGDGEVPLGILCDALENQTGLDDVPNIWYRKEDGEVVSKTFQNSTPNLDILPFPDRDLFDFPNLEAERGGMTTLGAGRGCPYGCTYCSNNYLKKMFHGNQPYLRQRSPENVVQEAEEIIKKYPFIKEFFFIDDILPINRDWFRELAKLYAERVNIPYHCAIYPKLINEDILDSLKLSNCKTLNIGLESGNEEIRKSLLKRNLPTDFLKGVIDMCRNYDIRLLTFNILGLPGETFNQMLETVDLNAYAFRGSDDINAAASIFYPYEQTDLHTLCETEGLIPNSVPRVNSHFQDSILDYTEDDKVMIKAVQRHFKDLVKISMKEGPLAERGDTEVINIMRDLDSKAATAAAVA